MVYLLLTVEDGNSATFALESDADCSASNRLYGYDLLNYSEAAVVDDGSCTYPTSLTL